jgi:hypothetical protein
MAKALLIIIAAAMMIITATAALATNYPMNVTGKTFTINDTKIINTTGDNSSGEHDWLTGSEGKPICVIQVGAPAYSRTGELAFCDPNSYGCGDNDGGCCDHAAGACIGTLGTTNYIDAGKPVSEGGCACVNQSHAIWSVSGTGVNVSYGLFNDVINSTFTIGESYQFSFDEGTQYMGLNVWDSPDFYLAPLCTPSYSCSLQGACNSSDIIPCNMVVDGACGTTYNPLNYSDYDANCTYTTPTTGFVPTYTSDDVPKVSFDVVGKTGVAIAQLAGLFAIALVAIAVMAIVIQIKKR